jgi:hypothetical protein
MQSGREMAEERFLLQETFRRSSSDNNPLTTGRPERTAIETPTDVSIANLAGGLDLIVVKAW